MAETSISEFHLRVFRFLASTAAAGQLTLSSIPAAAELQRVEVRRNGRGAQGSLFIWTLDALRTPAARDITVNAWTQTKYLPSQSQHQLFFR